jgi:ATP-dependent DNA helicase RecG
MGSPESAFRLARLGLCGPLLGGDRGIHGFGGVVALVHRPYTQRGDIFLNLHPDRLEVVNPGPLPLGVTPQNVLHTTVRRNEHLLSTTGQMIWTIEGIVQDRLFESDLRPEP